MDGRRGGRHPRATRRRREDRRWPGTRRDAGVATSSSARTPTQEGRSGPPPTADTSQTTETRGQTLPLTSNYYPFKHPGHFI